VFDSGYTDRDGGTGLGLTIVDRIATAHGWTVSLADAASGGARFEFRGVD
jgi:signal transduction histidine kinase